MAGFEPAMTALKERRLNQLAHIATEKFLPEASGEFGAAGRTRTLIDPLTACCLEDSAGTAAKFLVGRLELESSSPS